MTKGIYDEIFQQVADEMNLEKKVVSTAYLISWKFVKEKIEALPLKEDLTREEFRKLRTTFKIPHFGNLYLKEDYFFWKKNNYKKYNSSKNKSNED